MGHRNFDEPLAVFERGELERDEFLKFALEKGFLHKVKMKDKEFLWKPSYLSYVACDEGCLNSLGMDICMAWLNYRVGHIFIINIHDTECSGVPDVWGDIDLKCRFEFDLMGNRSGKKENRRLKNMWKEINGLLGEIYPAISGSGISPTFMLSLAKGINDAISQVKGLEKNSVTLKLGYWKSSLNTDYNEVLS